MNEMHCTYKTKVMSRNNKHGNALMLVLILFMVISILSLAMLAIAGTENAQVIAEEKIDQAHYTARAVVQATYDWMYANKRMRDDMTQVIPARTTLGESYAKTSSSQLAGREYDLKVWRDSGDEDLIHIQATAYYQGHSGLSSTVSMTLQETISDYVLFEDAIYSKGPFGDLGGHTSGNSNTVIGSVATAADYLPDNLNYSLGGKTNKYFDFPVILPDDNVVYSDYIAALTLNAGNYMNIGPNLNANIGTLTLSGGSGNGKNVYIQNSADSSQSVYIKIENLNISAETTLVPTYLDGGRIFIYVTGNINIDQQINILGDSTDSNYIPRVYLICSGDGYLLMEGNAEKYLYIYGPDINVEFKGCDNYFGAIIANIFGWTGALQVEYRDPDDFAGSPFAGLDTEAGRVAITPPIWYNK